MLFEELNINPNIIKAIQDLNYTELTPIQEQSINYILDGKDVLAEAPTGTGKTCAFAIPLIEKLDPTLDKVQALVLVPTRELAIQVTKEIRNYYTYVEGCSSLPIYGGQQISRQIMLLKKHPNIIVSTPGRLIDHLERKTIRLNNLKYLVLDECDEMLDMGFKPDIEKILEYVKGEHQTLMFSATISEDIKKISKEFQHDDKVFIKVERQKKFNEVIKQYYVRVPENDKKKTLTNILNGFDYDQCFIFVRTKTKVVHLTNILNIIGFNVTSIHGDLNQHQRDEAMKSFRSGNKKVLVATDIAARGLDIGTVDLVINYDLPDEDEYYLHRIGRTGRANGYGTAITFFMKSQMVLKSKFEAMTMDKIEEFKLYSKKEEEKMMAKKTLDELENTIINSSCNDYVGYCKEFLEKVNSEGENVSALKLAAVLLKELASKPSVELVTASEKVKDNNSENEEHREPKAKDTKKASTDNVRYFINVGLKDGLKEVSLRSLIMEKCGIVKEHFEDVYCKQTFSFVELPASDEEALMSGLVGVSYNGRSINVEASEGKKHHSHEEKDHHQNHSRDHHSSSFHSSSKSFKDKKNTNRRK